MKNQKRYTNDAVVVFPLNNWGHVWDCICFELGIDEF